MTKVSGLAGKRIYLDANILIHFIEGHRLQADSLRELFDAVDARTVAALTSELSLAEALVKPLALGRRDVAGIYETILSDTSPIEVVAVDRNVLVRSAEIRAREGGHMFDAIHVATAMRHGCDYFLSEDERVRSPSELPVLRLDELLDRS